MIVFLDALYEFMAQVFVGITVLPIIIKAAFEAAFELLERNVVVLPSVALRFFSSLSAILLLLR